MQIALGRITLTGRQAAGLALLLAAGLMLTAFYRQIDLQAIHQRAESLNGVLVFVLLTLLPLAGFPVTIAHAAAGIRFGLGWGFVLVAFSILLQMFASYGLVRMAPGFFARRLEPVRQRLPHAAHQPLTIFTMLLPGAPYVAQIYVLPLAGVPLQTFIAWSFPITAARSVIGITFGDVSDNLTPLRIAGFCLYGLAITATCAWSFQRLRARLADPPAAAGDPTPRG
ncbi:MAG TPA: hypothetical protein VGD81_13255 [Opitutaceae bacterium]